MAVARSAIGKHFNLDFSGHPHERKGSRFMTEMRAGLATFFAMAYIISVNASIVAGMSLHHITETILIQEQQVVERVYVNQTISSLTTNFVKSWTILQRHHTITASWR